jgi:hypothetical protein
MRLLDRVEQLICFSGFALMASFVVGAGCAALSSPGVQSALQAVAPSAVEALTAAVVKRWGPEAEVDTGSALCFELPDAVQIEGDDGYAYVLCRAKATKATE